MATPPKSRLAQGLVPLVAAVAIAGTGYWYFFGRAPSENAQSTAAPQGCVVNPPARIGAPLTLKAAQVTGETTQANFAGKPTLLYFGFTHCPDVCPTTMYLVADALNALGPRAGDIQAALVSLDPDRDTPDVLAAYTQTEGFPRGLVGLVGNQDEIAAAAHAFAVSYQRAPLGDDYTINHTSFLYVMDGAWRTRSMISTIGRTPEDVAACVRAGLGADLR